MAEIDPSLLSVLYLDTDPVVGSMESLITSDSSDDLLAEAGSEDSGELFVEDDKTELDKVILGTAEGVGSNSDHVHIPCESTTNTDEACTEIEASKSSDREEKASLSRDKRGGSEKTGAKKKRRTRERKISICSDHSTFIAGVKMEVIKEGYVTQQGSFQRLVKKYVTIANDRLYIAKNKEDKLHEEIVLKDVKVAENSTKNENHSFSVLTPFQQLSFATGSRKEMEEWITAFKMADSKSKQTAILESIQHLEGQHSWFACSHGRPTYCNVCREQLHGVAWHGLSCEVCKFKSHRRCVFSVKTPCKWTTRSSLTAAGVKLEQDFTIPHEWVEGNIPAGSKCAVCERNCGSVRRLQDFRCLWCKQTVHTECKSKMEKVCNLGEHRLSILPPSALQRSDAIREGMWEPYKMYGHSPVLACVNSKSGDNQGVKFLRRLKYWLNPAQVFDLAISGPELGVQLFQRFEKFRVIVLGGDGSIGWVLSTIDKFKLHSKCMVGVVPLGTGNDMARVLGWGAQATDEEKIPQILAEMEQSSFKLLDRWSVHFSPQQNLNISHILGAHSPVKGDRGRPSVGSIGTSGAISPRPPYTTASSRSHHAAPFPGPTSSIRDTVSPDSVFSLQNSITSSGSSGSLEPSVLRTPSPEQSSLGPVSMDTHTKLGSKGTEHARNASTDVHIAYETTGGSKKQTNIITVENEQTDSTNANDDNVSNRHHEERGVVCSSPEDIAKIEAFHDIISGLAAHFTTILFSENEQEVMSSTQVLGEVVTDFLRSIVAGAENQLSMTEFQSDPVVKKCVILQDKLNALLSNLKNETSGLSGKETQQPVVRDGGNGRGFVEREAVMARANSLKKALRGVIDVTEKALDDSTEQATHLPLVAEEEQQDVCQDPDSQSGTESGQASTTCNEDKDLSLAIRREHLSSTASVVELSPGIPTMKELSCMNNYFGIGFGAHVAYQFNSAREKNPGQFKSRAKNKLLYGYLGGKELFTNSQRYLERRIQLECDGEVIKLPQKLQGLVFLNIPSYMAGTNFWGTEREKEGFSAPSHDDKLMEVVGITGFSHLATTKVLGIQNQRVTQCRVAKITLLGPDKLAMQVDGEAWLQETGTIVVSHKNKARMIFKDKAFSQSLEQWRQKNIHQASSFNPTPRVTSTVHTVLTSDQATKYKEVATSVRQLMACITSESSANASVNTDLLPYVSNVSMSLKHIFQDNQLSETANVTHLQDFEEDVKALVQESLWFLNMHKISRSCEDEMRSIVQNVESQMRRIIAVDLSECSVAHHNFRRASDTLMTRLPIQDEGRKTTPTVTPHRERAQLIPDATTRAAAIAKKIGKDVEFWDNDDVCEWLDELDLEEHCESFRNSNIRGKHLLSFKKSDLQALGVTKIGHVTRLWHALQALTSYSPSLPRFNRVRETH